MSNPTAHCNSVCSLRTSQTNPTEVLLGTNHRFPMMQQLVCVILLVSENGSNSREQTTGQVVCVKRMKHIILIEWSGVQRSGQELSPRSDSQTVEGKPWSIKCSQTADGCGVGLSARADRIATATLKQASDYHGHLTKSNKTPRP